MPKLQRDSLGRSPRIPLSSLLDPSMIRIVVGDKKELFLIHEKIACYHFEYFRALFSGSFAEVKSKEVLRDDEDPDVVKLLVSWLYFQTIDLDTHTISRVGVSKPNGNRDIRDAIARGFRNADLPSLYDSSNDESSTESSSTDSSPNDEGDDNRAENKDKQTAKINTWQLKFFALFKIWILADKCGMRRLQDETISVLHRAVVTSGFVVASMGDVAWAWEHTTFDSNLRKILIEMIAVTWLLDIFNERGYQISSLLQTAIIRRVSDIYDHPGFARHWESLWKEINVCQWHHHPHGIDCRGKPLDSVSADQAPQPNVE